MTDHKLAQPEAQRDPQAPDAPPRSASGSGRFVAEGEDLLAAADAAGWQAVERYCAAGSGLPGVEVEPSCSPALPGSDRAPGPWRSMRSGGRRRRSDRCASIYTASTTRATSARCFARPQAFGASCVAIGPASADPFGPKAVRASMGAVFAVPLGEQPSRDDSLDRLPGTRIALVANGGAPLADA